MTKILFHNLRLTWAGMLLPTVLLATPTAIFRHEEPGRGLVALPAASEGVYVGWRLLASDDAAAGFHVYRRCAAEGVVRLNEAPITDSTNFWDRTGQPDQYHYLVVGLAKSQADTDMEFVGVDQRADVGGYRSLPLDGNYEARHVGFGDLTGDGRLDYVIIRPGTDVQPYWRVRGPLAGTGTWRPSEETPQLEAYAHDGRCSQRGGYPWKGSDKGQRPRCQRGAGLHGHRK